MNKKKNIKEVLWNFAVLWFGASILAFGLFNIHNRTHVTEGGVLGMTLLLQHWFHITPGITGLILDGICYFMGYKILGKHFLANAVTASCGFSFFYNLFEHLGYMLPDFSNRPIAAAILGGIFVGVGAGIIVRKGGASGGDDALAIIISKKYGWRIGHAYFFTDFVVLMLSLSYIPYKKIIYSLFTVTISSFIVDQIILMGRRKKIKQRKENGAGTPDTGGNSEKDNDMEPAQEGRFRFKK